MTIAAQYAKALHAASEEYPRKKIAHLRGLREALKRRGHERLGSKIFSEYKKLLLKEERRTHYQTITPERERTRILLQLYRKLIDG